MVLAWLGGELKAMLQSFFDSFDGTQIHCWAALPESAPYP